jgi:hypothetical protein
MRNLLLGVAAATSLLGATMLVSSAQAAPQASVVFGVDRAGGALAVTPAQYVYLGHNYCWYDAGWQGAGFYWCGYAQRRGFGWGGGSGFRGWNHGSGGGRAIVTGGRGGGRTIGVRTGGVRVAAARTGGSTRGGGHTGGGHTGGGHTAGGHTAGGHTGDHKQ